MHETTRVTDHSNICALQGQISTHRPDISTNLDMYRHQNLDCEKYVALRFQTRLLKLKKCATKFSIFFG